MNFVGHSIAEACDGDGTARFTEMVAGNIVNSSVLVHCISLTSSGLSCPPRSWLGASCNGYISPQFLALQYKHAIKCGIFP